MIDKDSKMNTGYGLKGDSGNGGGNNVNLSWKEKALLIVAALAAVTFGVIGCVDLGKTIVNQWIPIGIAFGIACWSLPLGIMFWKRSVPGLSKWIDGGIHLVFATALAFFLIFCINNAGANFDKGDQVEATIVKKFTKEHTTRSGRRLQRAGRKYNTWHIRLAFPNGKEKEVQIGSESYYRLRKGGKIKVTMASGTFGWDVFKF